MKYINIVKIGSDSINENNLSKLVSDILALDNIWNEKYIIISSWAVKLWRNKVESFWLDSKKYSKSALSSIWQPLLIKAYENLFSWQKIMAQILIDDFASDIFLANTLDKLFADNIISIINHNDTIHNNELKNVSLKADNDKNTVHICKVLNILNKREERIQIKRVIYLTNTNWLLDSNKNTVLWWKINLEEEKDFYRNFVQKWEKSSAWTWWMESKLNCAFECLLEKSWESIISNSKFWLDFLISWDTSKITKFY